MNVLILKLLYSVSKLLHLTVYLIFWSAYPLKLCLLKASLRLERYVQSKGLFKSKQTLSSKGRSTGVSHLQPTQRPRDL